MIKKIILGMIGVVFGLEGIAQKSTTLSIYVMPQRTMFYNGDDYTYKGIVRNAPTYAYSYGAILSQNFNSRLGLEYGFYASRVEQEFEIYPYAGASAPGVSNRKSNLYLNIPLLLKVQLISKPKNILSVSTGPVASFLMSEDGIIPVYYREVGVPSDTVNAFDITEASGAYRKLVFAAAGTLSWNTRIYKNVFLQFLVRADYTLTDVENKSFDALFLDDSYTDVYYFFNKNRPATHIVTMGVGMGVNFKLR